VRLLLGQRQCHLFAQIHRQGQLRSDAQAGAERGHSQFRDPQRLRIARAIGAAQFAAQARAQHIGIGGPAGADHAPRRGRGQIERVGLEHAFIHQRLQRPLRVAAIGGGVDIAHARVDHRQDGGVIRLRFQRQRRERGNRQHRQLQRQRHALGQRHADAHAGAGAGSATDSEGIQRVAVDAGLGQQRLGHRQHQLGVAARRDLAARNHGLAVDQRHGARLGSGFNRQQIHGRP
jgi:hypothetical protein